MLASDLQSDARARSNLQGYAAKTLTSITQVSLSPRFWLVSAGTSAVCLPVARCWAHHVSVRKS